MSFSINFCKMVVPGVEQRTKKVFLLSINKEIVNCTATRPRILPFRGSNNDCMILEIRI